MNSYVLMYKEASSTGSFEEVTEISQQGYTVENLEPYTEYIFQVAAVNAIGRGRPSTETRERTGELGKWHRVEKKQNKVNETKHWQTSLSLLVCVMKMSKNKTKRGDELIQWSKGK